MPHFNANKVVILKQEDVPEGYTLKEIYEAMENKQFPLKVKRGAVAFDVGMLIRAYLGRDAIVGDIGFDPVFKLIVDKETVAVEVDEDDKVIESEIITVVKYLEWGF